jgi:hypothetical protein
MGKGESPNASDVDVLHLQHEPLNVYVALVRQFTHAPSGSATMPKAALQHVNRIDL